MSIILYDAVSSLIDPSQIYGPPAVVGEGSLDATLALGGYRASNPKPNVPRRFDNSAYRFFRDILPAEAVTGITLYRAFAVQTTVALTACKVWLGNAVGGSTATAAFGTDGSVVTFGLDPAAANQAGAIITSETTAPAGVVFSAPASGAPLDLGALSAGQSRIVWMKLVVPSGCPATQSDYQVFTIRPDTSAGTGTPLSWLTWWNITAGVKIAQVQTDMEGRVISLPRGATFTINVTDALTGLVAQDPGDAYISPTCFVQITTSDTVQSKVWRTIDICQRISTGLYSYRFWPTTTGHYLLVFDIGEDLFSVSVMVSSVGDDTASVAIVGATQGGISGVGVIVNGVNIGTEPVLAFAAVAPNMVITGVDAPPRVNLTFASRASVGHAGSLVGTEQMINFIDGTNATVGVVDNPGSNRVDVTVNSTGGGGGGGGGGLGGGAFGYADGFDGALHFDGTSTVTLGDGVTIIPSASVYSLNSKRNLYASSITVDVGVKLFVDRYAIFCTGTFTNNGTVHDNGANASGFNGSATGNDGWLKIIPSTGGGGSATNGAAGSSLSPAFGGAGGAGGAGSGGRTGGAGGTITKPPDPTSGGAAGWLRLWGFWSDSRSAQGAVGSGAAGGGGGGDTVNNGGGGGGGGGWLNVCANVLAGTGTFSANGGNGANGTGGNSGGGGGGGGGIVTLYYGSLAVGLTVQANGGTAGTAAGTGANGTAGSVGIIIKEQASAGVGGGANTNDNFWVATAAGSTDLPNAVVLGSLATGLLKNTTGTGVPTIAVAGVDYALPGASTVPSGAIVMWPTTTAPATWLVCDGSAVNRTTFAALFAVIGTTYGAGDGSTTFNVPDLRSRSPVGYAASPPGGGRSARALAAVGGEETHLLVVGEMPSHNHTVTAANTHSQIVNTNGQPLDLAGSFGSVTGFTGGEAPHNNMQPFQVVNYIIKE